MSVTSIRFGTDGWRAIIAEEFTFENVVAVATALAAYLHKHEKQRARNGVAVGYDTRFLAAEFARAAANAIAAAGIPVWLADGPAPAPAIAWATRERKLAGGVMITAGHNGPTWNGLKFFAPTGASADKDATNAVEAVLGRKAPTRAAPAPVTSFDPRPAYFAQLRRVIDFDLIRSKRLTVVYDPMHGAGQGYLNVLLKECGWKVTTIRDQPDPMLGGVLPDPADPESHAALQAAVMRKDADLGLANDPDGGRFGAVDATGTSLPPNAALALIYLHLLEHRGLRGPVARSLPTTSLLDVMAESFGQTVIETPVGYRWVGAAMDESGAILGGEESGGLSISGHFPGKDGILANLLLAEITSLHGQPLSDIYKKVGKRFSAPHWARIDLKLSPEQKAALMAKMKSTPPAELAGLQVTEVIARDGVKLKFENGGWMMLRPSGTEPVVRVYMESLTSKGLKQLQKAARGLN